MSGGTPRCSLVVVADDEPQLLELLEMVLTGDAREVATARDGLSAWQLIRERHPELVVLDAVMPGIDGLELTRRIRRDPALAGIGVILISGLASPEEEARRAGADHCLPKPARHASYAAPSASCWTARRESPRPGSLPMRAPDHRASAPAPAESRKELSSEPCR
ncbi:MAG TPA: response regulator [Chloroflexota bacterium]|nr:response regulator [Chloroflexota bacterium]